MLYLLPQIFLYIYKKQFYIKCSGLSFYNVIVVCHCNNILGNCSIKKEEKSIILKSSFRGLQDAFDFCCSIRADAVLPESTKHRCNFPHLSPINSSNQLRDNIISLSKYLNFRIDQFDIGLVIL